MKYAILWASDLKECSHKQKNPRHPFCKTKTKLTGFKDIFEKEIEQVREIIVTSSRRVLIKSRDRFPDYSFLPNKKMFIPETIWNKPKLIKWLCTSDRAKPKNNKSLSYTLNVFQKK